MIIDFRTRPPFKSYNTMNVGRIILEKTTPRKAHAFRFKAEPNPSYEQKSMELYMREMDEAGIDMAVLIGRDNGNYLGKGQVTIEDTYELTQLYPGRFIGFAALDPGGNPIQKMEHAIKDLGFKGISLEPAVGFPPMHLNDPSLNDIYACAQELGAVVSLTMSGLVGPDYSYNDPARLVDVAQRYPKTNFFIPHAGWPKVAEMIGACMRCANIYLSPDFYAYIPSMPMSDEYVAAANGFLRYRTLFATSYPFRGLKQAVREWSSLPFVPEVRDLIMYQNAQYLLGMRDE